MSKIGVNVVLSLVVGVTIESQAPLVHQVKELVVEDGERVSLECLPLIPQPPAYQAEGVGVYLELITDH